MSVRALLWVGLLAWQLHAPLADARSGGSGITVPNFANPLASVAPATTLGNAGQSTVGSATTNSVASGTSVNGGLVPRSTSPFVPPLVQTRPPVTTSVLTNTGNGTFTVTTVPQTFGLFTFSNGAMTPVSGNVLAPNVVTPRHDMTQAKIIVFQ
jgi:hypothetical protein